MPPLERTEKEAIAIHFLFSLVCLAVLLLLPGIPVGLRLLFLVFVYNTTILSWGLFRRDREWIHLWLFCITLSVFQVFPDWFLSAQLDILVFPEDGCFRIGTVSGYMAGLWAIPLFIILYVGDRVRQRVSMETAWVIVAVLSLMIFGGSEAFLWMLPSWHAKNVTMIGHVAVYILGPEIILGLFAFAGYQFIKSKPLWTKVPIAFLVMLLYLGSAAYFYFLIEKIIW